ncbi:MAG: Amino acid permease [Parachlamydiales bacterium]|nr:Amino acid permease [Parachlamydiales bacterium]
MQTKRVLTSWMIAMINVAAICNIQNFALMAEYGLAMVFFLIFSSICFFIPVSLVSAELASGWSDRGVYTWVKEGLNPCLGFLAIWLQWIQNVFWYPTILSFAAATFSYIFMPQLAENRIYLLSIILSTFWAATLVSLFGMRISGWISTISALFGTILPIALILILGIVWLFKGLPSQIDFSFKSILPDLSSFKELVLLSGFIFSLSGLEMSAIHAKDAAYPKTDYPKAIFLSAAMIVTLSILGSVTVATIVPHNSIELTSGGMEAFRAIFTAFGIPWAIPIIAAIVTFGALGMMSTWIVGPSRGLLATAVDGDFPPLLQKMNKNSMPVAIFILQAIIVSILSLIFLYMPNISTSYWILIAMAAKLYMIMYILMFISAIRLRYIKPHVERAYRVPGGMIGMWIVSGLGICSSIFALIISFIPPSQLATGSLALYESILIGGSIFFCGLPLLIYWMRKPEWKRTPSAAAS